MVHDPIVAAVRPNRYFLDAGVTVGGVLIVEATPWARSTAGRAETVWKF